MKHIVGVLVLLFGMNAFAVREVQNGGGGVNSSGNMETFFSANFKLQDDPESPENIPGLARLINEIDSMPIKASVKGLLMASVFPTMDRNYYRVKGGELSQATRDSIYREYARMMQIPVSKVVLFAATGPESKITVLMKEYYSLKESEQAAILLHEGLWIVSSNLTYEQVVSLEVDAQAYFQDHNNVQALYRFATNLGNVLADRTLPLVTSLAIDFQRKIAPMDQGGSLQTVKLVDLLGERYVDCMILHDFSNYKTRVGDIDYVRACNQVISQNAVLRASKNPKSLYYPALLVYMGRAGHVDLLSRESDVVHLMYNGIDSNYVEWRNNLYVNFQEPVAGNRMDLLIYDQDQRIVGRVRF